MGFSLGGSKQKTSQQQTQNMNQTSTFNPSQGFLGLLDPAINRAQGLMGQSQGPLSGADVANYLNPNMDYINQNLSRQAGIAANNNDAQAAAAGAFGGTGWGLLRGETARGFADAAASASANAYTTAQQMALADREARNNYDLNSLGAYGGLLGLLGNWGTTNTTGTSTGTSTGTQKGSQWGLAGYL